jgi:hypothetical protein
MMKSLIAAALLLTPALALADPPSRAPDPARQARMEQRLHTFRAIGLAEALNLDAGQAIQLDQSMSQFDERRKPLHEQLRQSKQLLERAADGDPATLNQVDAAIASAFSAKAQLEQVDRDMLTTVSKGMSPQQKAKLSVFLARFKHEMMRRFEGGEMRGGHGWGHRGPGGEEGTQGR